MSHSNYVI